MDSIGWGIAIAGIALGLGIAHSGIGRNKRPYQLRIKGADWEFEAEAPSENGLENLFDLWQKTLPDTEEDE